MIIHKSLDNEKQYIPKLSCSWRYVFLKQLIAYIREGNDKELCDTATGEIYYTSHKLFMSSAKDDKILHLMQKTFTYMHQKRQEGV